MALGVTDLKKGAVFSFEGTPYIVVEYSQKVVGRGGSIVSVRTKSLLDGKVIERTFKGNEQLDNVDLAYKNVQYLYNDGSTYFFMDNDNYEQFELAKDVIGDQKGFMREGDTVKAGDIILKAAGKVIDRSTELPAVIAALAPGSDVDLEVWRDRSVKKLNVKIIALQEQAEKVALNKEPGMDSSALGLSVRPLTSDEQKQVGTTGTLVVEQVDGPAEEAGVQPGDVILGVNGARVKTSRELQDAAKKGGKTVALLIQRENAQIFVPIRIG